MSFTEVLLAAGFQPPPANTSEQNFANLLNSRTGDEKIANPLLLVDAKLPAEPHANLSPALHAIDTHGVPNRDVLKQERRQTLEDRQRELAFAPDLSVVHLDDEIGAAVDENPV